MNPQMNILPKLWAVAAFALAVALSLALAGCFSDVQQGDGDSSSGQTIPEYGPSVALTLPDTLTGGSGAAPASILPRGLSPMARGIQGSAIRPMAAGGDPCAFQGHGNGDPFKNGHTMTKFLVGAIASWSCIADNIIRFVDILVFWGVPTDGTPLDIASGSSDYQPGDATWVSINEDPDGDPATPVTEVRLYWTTVGVAPTVNDLGFFMAWDTSGGNVDGRLIVDVSRIVDPPGSLNPAEDPMFLRLDFNRNTGVTQTGDMYLGFDQAAHPWVQGWHIHVTKALDGSTPRFLAKGVIDMTAQWDTRYNGPPGNYPEFPQLKSFAVADSLGVGAAIASMVDLGLVLYPVDSDLDHLGTFLFTKDDRYYFGGGSPVVKKAVTTATYKGDLLINGGGGITSAADVDLFLTGVGGMTGTQYGSCVAGGASADADCVIFLDALFSNGDFGAEANVGTEPDPGDQRRDALDNPSYYNTACPDPNSNTCVWGIGTGEVFEMAYVPGA